MTERNFDDTADALAAFVDTIAAAYDVDSDRAASYPTADNWKRLADAAADVAQDIRNAIGVTDTTDPRLCSVCRVSTHGECTEHKRRQP